MITHEVTSFGELHDVFRQFTNDKRWLFRGHRDASWRLIPKAGRNAHVLRNERLYFESWKRRAVEYIGQTPPSDWDWLAVAQHHGFFTRLLDWTANPLVACFFAVVEPEANDAAVYAFRPTRGFNLRPDNLKPDGTPFRTTEGIAEYRPSAFSDRISRQNARFTLHNPADTDLLGSDGEYGDLEQILINKRYVGDLAAELDLYGYNYASIYPGLDGLSEHLNWLAARKAAPEPVFEEET